MARRAATVLLPAPAGPSMAMMMRWCRHLVSFIWFGRRRSQSPDSGRFLNFAGGRPPGFAPEAGRGLPPPGLNLPPLGLRPWPKAGRAPVLGGPPALRPPGLNPEPPGLPPGLNPDPGPDPLRLNGFAPVRRPDGGLAVPAPAPTPEDGPEGLPGRGEYGRDSPVRGRKRRIPPASGVAA